jgi:hypothetical protein
MNYHGFILTTDTEFNILSAYYLRACERMWAQLHWLELRRPEGARRNQDVAEYTSYAVEAYQRFILARRIAERLQHRCLVSSKG